MEQLFGLNPQLLHDAVLSILAILFLFTLMSYLLFNPAKKMLKDTDICEEAAAVKAEYDEKIRGIEKEAEEILSEARQKALKNESRIVDEAKEEAARIIKRANEEALLEKKRIMDEAKQEMIAIASMMAGKVVTASIDTSIQDALVEETLKEIGESTWQS